MQFGLGYHHDTAMQMDGHMSTTCADGRMQWPLSPVSPSGSLFPSQQIGLGPPCI